MQAISDRPGGACDPSPGEIHPTIAQLEDEGLATTREERACRSLILPSEGHSQLEEGSVRLGDPFANFADTPNRPDLTDPLYQLPAPVRQIEGVRDATQLKAAAKILVQATVIAVFDLGPERSKTRTSELKTVPSLVLAHPSQAADRFSTAPAQPSPLRMKSWQRGASAMSHTSRWSA